MIWFSNVKAVCFALFHNKRVKHYYENKPAHAAAHSDCYWRPCFATLSLTTHTVKDKLHCCGAGCLFLSPLCACVEK